MIKLDIGIKKTHTIIVKLDEKEARDIADFLDHMDNEKMLQGEDTVYNFYVQLFQKINSIKE